MDPMYTHDQIWCLPYQYNHNADIITFLSILCVIILTSIGLLEMFTMAGKRKEGVKEWYPNAACSSRTAKPATLRRAEQFKNMQN